MIRRRSLLLTHGFLPIVHQVQAQGVRRVVGFIGPSAYGPNSIVIKPLVDGMRALGWTEGDNFILEYRATLGDVSRTAELVRELQQRHIAVLVTLTTGIPLEAHRADPS